MGVPNPVGVDTSNKGVSEKMSKRAVNRKGERYVIYGRISEDRPGVETSTRTQEKEAREFGDRNGWQYVDTFLDVGISAYKGKRRPGLDEAIGMIERGQADVLLVWKLDRLVRSITNYHAINERVRAAGGRIASVTDSFLNGDDRTVGQMMAGLVAGFGQMESEIKSDRIKAWQRDRIEQGKPNGGSRPYGYRFVQGGLVIVPAEAEVLRESARRILNRESSLRGCVRELSPLSPRDTGIPMTHRGLRSALTNPTVAGLRRNDDDYVSGNWEPILSRQTWDAINDLFSDPTRRTGSGNQVAHLLSGLMKCDRCGKGLGIRKWKANPTKRQTYTQEAHRLTCPCGNSISEANANRVVTDRLWETVTPAVWRSWRAAGTGWDEATMNELQRLREKIITMEIQGKVSAEWADAELADIDLREAVAKGDAPMNLPDTDDPRRDWESLSITDQRQILAYAFPSITLRESNGCRDPQIRIVTK